MCLTRQPEGECRSPDLAKMFWLRIAVHDFAEMRDGYFLFFRFRIETIKLETAMIIMNPS